MMDFNFHRSRIAKVSQDTFAHIHNAKQRDGWKEIDKER